MSAEYYSEPYVYMHGHTAASETATFVRAFVCGARPGVVVGVS